MAGMPPQMSPQMMQMLSAGGAGGPPGAGGGAPSPTAPPAAAAIGRMLQGQRMTPQGSGQMESKIIEQCMVQVGKVLQTIMMSNPKAYQTLLKAQMSLHSALQQMKEGAQDEAEHAQMTSSIMQLLRSSPGGSTATGGVPSGAGSQLG
jgi:hypothetical protein